MNQILSTPLFVPYNVRNQIINENCTEQKDIERLPNQYDILTSYMDEEQIFTGINDRIGKAIFSKTKANPITCNGIEAFKKNNVLSGTGLIKQIIKNIGNSGKSSKLNMGFDFSDVALLASLNVGEPFDDTDLTAYWKFNAASSPVPNESESAADLGTAADIAITNGTFSQTGIIGDAVSFNGTTSFGICGTSTSQWNYMHNTSALWTIAVWLNYDNTNGGDLFDTQTNTTSANIGMSMIVTSAEAINFEIHNGTGAQEILTGSTGASYVPDSDWHLYIATYDQSLGSNNLAIRRDDANLVNLSKSAFTPSNSNAQHQANTMRRENSSSFLEGLLDEWSMWNKVMSTDDQTLLYNSGAGLQIY